MMDIRNLAAGLRERYGYTASNDLSHPTGEAQPDETGVGEEVPLSKDEGENELDKSAQDDANQDLESPSRFISPLDLSNGKAVVSLANMVHATNALKANIDVEFVTPDVQWLGYLPSRSPSPSKQQQHVPQRRVTESTNMGNVAQAISGLQREVLLLRNELNFELWIQRENVKHIGRLYQDRILMKSAEAERQGLVCILSHVQFREFEVIISPQYNKLRKYRSQVKALEDELREHKQQASSAKNKYADWNTELQKKLKELREEKKSWISEAATLRGAEKEAKVRSHRALPRGRLVITLRILDLVCRSSQTPC